MEHCRIRLIEELSCSLCLRYFNDPVNLDCGHNFCRACITKNWDKSPMDTACPQCQENTEVMRLTPNTQLAKMVEISKDMDNLLKHCYVNVEEAAEECKEQINDSLEFLWKEREIIMQYKAKNDGKSRALLSRIQAERQKTKAVFGDLRQFLVDKEKLLLTQMNEVEKKITRRRNDNHTCLSEELSSLDSLIQELEEMLKQSASELVQNVQNVLKRCPAEPFSDPVVFPVALQWKIHNFADINCFLEGLMKRFKDSLTDGLHLQQVSVTLDPDTAHRKIILSDDCKKATYGPAIQDVPNNPERFDRWPFVLGQELISSGRHYWDVALGSEESWAVGVAKYDVKRKGDFNVCPCEGIWYLGRWGGAYRISGHPSSIPLPLTHKSMKIRVIVNCAGSRVSFFNADTAEQLHISSVASLPGEDLLPFFYVWGGGTLTLLPLSLPKEAERDGPTSYS